MNKISIITAIHNGLPINKIYFEFLKKYTHYPFELIIIDNLSTDGSREFFEAQGAVVIANKVNSSYPVSQNQGIEVATCEYLFFLNNDIIVCPNWDKILIDAAQKHSLDVLTASGIENMGNLKDTRAISKRWKRIKMVLLPFGIKEYILRAMFKIMYGNWEKYCSKLFDKNQYNVVEGIVGDNVMITKNGISKIGLWDETQQGADFDLFMRAKHRSITHKDIKPCHIVLGAYIHHFGKMTLKYGKRKPVPFADNKKLIALSDKWTEQQIEALHPNNATLRLKK